MLKEYAFPKIEKLISSLLKSCLSDLGIYEPPTIIIEIPKEKLHGDLTSNIAFRLSSTLKKSPKEIAEMIASACRDNLDEFDLFLVISEIKVAPSGFINFYLKDKFLHNMLLKILDTKDVIGGNNLGKGKKTQIEFVSANPTGPLSIAHGRQAATGDVLARILTALGFKVTREYYNNDEGNQIYTLGKSLELRYRQLQGEKVEFPGEYYQGQYVVTLAMELLLKEIQLKDTQDFSNFALEKITRIIKEELEDFGVKFDFWYSQRELRSSKKINKALNLLKKKGFIYEKEGATWFKSTHFGDDKDRVVIKSSNNYTYLAPDIAYHLDKFDRGFKWLINIWGPDHHGYIPRIKGVIQALGHDKESLSVIIVQLATIYRDGKPVPMSTRKGQYITLRDIINEVGTDAARFFFLMRRTDSHLDFDLDMAKKQSPENPVYYVQYAHARICSILNNAGDIKFNSKKIDLKLLKQEEEKQLLQLIFQFSYVIEVCFRQLDPYPITAYLQDLATAFHRFYDRHKVLGEDANLTLARLALIKCLQIVFAKGLDLLGISKPEKM
ncbi:MAG: arginine--tRNA ligase [Candidatus Omnitrophica bacterium]|nr:arginine--tRNA ligase [Candidatus Omnitrophota bacterium]